MKCVISRMSPLASETQRKVQNPTETHQCAKKIWKKVDNFLLFHVERFYNSHFQPVELLTMNSSNCEPLMWTHSATDSAGKQHMLLSTGSENGLVTPHPAEKKFKLDPLLQIQTNPTLIRYLCCCIHGMIYEKKALLDVLTSHFVPFSYLVPLLAG